MTYSDKLVTIKLLDHEHVTLLSTAFNCALIATGKKALENQWAIKKEWPIPV